MTRPGDETLDILEQILDKPFRLSDEQRDAVLSNSQFSRVIAGAGAGKTETITRRIAYLLLVENVEPSSIVAFTFTNRAAQSMKSRIYQRVEEIAGAAATVKLGDMYVGTIHSYAKLVLDDYFGYGNYGVLDDNQEIAYLMRYGFELRINNFGSYYADACRKFLRTVEMVQGELLDDDILKKQAKDFHKCYTRYIELLKEHKQLTFGRMISEVVQKLSESPDTLDHVTHLIVDEYQDINRAQQEFIKLIAGQGSIYIVGDPRQSIYQWRGSDQRFFDEFAEDFTGTHSFEITENRRSTKRIVENANYFASTFKHLEVNPMVSARKSDGFLGLVSHEFPDDEAKWITDQIEDIVVNKQQLSFSDIGILARSVSTSVEPLVNEFKRRRIPYIIGGKVGLFRRDEAQALGRIFAWFWDEGFWTPDPWKWRDQITGDDLLTSSLAHWNEAHDHGVPTDAEEKLRAIKSELRKKDSRYTNFSDIYQDILVILGFQNLEFTNRNDAAVMANLGRFNNLLTDFETANRIGGRQPKWERDFRGLCWFMNSYGLQAYEEQPSDDIRYIDAVQIMTIHQAKGLEWPLVFLFSLTDLRFPPNAVGRQVDWCGIPRDLFDAKRYEGSLEDERRLFYVAITRPKDALILSHFTKMGRSVRRSRFLDDIDASMISIVDDDLPALTLISQIFGDELKTFSVSEILAYNRCPHMYLLRQLWGYQPGFVQAIDYGPALHYCLRVAGDLIKCEGLDPRTAVASAVDENFHMVFVAGDVFERYKNAANRTLTEFADAFGDDLTRVEEVEYRIEFPLYHDTDEGASFATIMGRIDVLIREADELEVRDYKTSVDEITLEEAAMQIRTYILGLQNMGRNVTKGSVADLTEPSIEAVEINPVSLNEANVNAEATVNRIADRDFKPCPGDYCSRCDYEKICRWSVD